MLIRIWEAAVVRRQNSNVWEKRHVCVCAQCQNDSYGTYGLARSGHDLLWFYSRDQLNENYRHHRLKCTRRHASRYTEVIALGKTISLQDLFACPIFLWKITQTTSSSFGEDFGKCVNLYYVFRFVSLQIIRTVQMDIMDLNVHFMVITPHDTPKNSTRVFFCCNLKSIPIGALHTFMSKYNYCHLWMVFDCETCNYISVKKWLPIFTERGQCDGESDVKRTNWHWTLWFICSVRFFHSLRVWFDALLSMCFTLNNIYVDFNSNQCHAI